MIGTELDGGYRIVEALGEGGTGTVYRAVHLERDLAVAVKVLRPDLASSPELRERFAREARALTALSHPNVVTVIDSGVSGTTAYLAMELLEGETLEARLKRGALEPHAVLGVLRQLLAALAYVHERGLVHRDVKPANVFLVGGSVDAGAVRLLDFGLAKFLAPDPGSPLVTRAGQVFGTPAYMAPEQVAGQDVDARADVYAAGIVWFEMLAGRKPFDGEPSEVLRQQIMDDLPISSLPPGLLSPATGAVLSRAAAKSRAERFTSAADMLSALDAATALVGPNDATLPELPDAGAAPTPVDPAAAPSVVPAPAVASPPVAVEPEAVLVDVPVVPSALAAWLPFVTVVASLVSLSATVVAVGTAYVLVTPGRAEERRIVERLLRMRPVPADSVHALAALARSAPAPAPAAPGQEPDRGPAPTSTPAVLASVTAPPSPPSAVEAAAGGAVEAPPRPRSPARDPWVSTPPELARFVAKASRPRGFDRPELLALHQYNAKHPTDARGHLLLARGYTSRKWFKDAVGEYAIAAKVDDTARGDPRMLKDLLTLVEFGAPDAAGLVRDVYGETALPAVERALTGRLPNPAAKALLERLRGELGP